MPAEFYFTTIPYLPSNLSCFKIKHQLTRTNKNWQFICASVLSGNVLAPLDALQKEGGGGEKWHKNHKVK